MKKYTAIIMLIISLGLIISGCSKQSIDELKDNSKATKEYNDIIRVYNKLALSFTSFAKDVDKQISEEAFDKDFWDKYSKKRAEIEEQKNMVENFQFKNKDIQKVMEDINPFIDNLEKYMELMESFKNSNVSKEEFTINHKKIYESMLKQSSKIVKTFDIIYNKHLIENN